MKFLKLILLVLVAALPAKADLTATVTPGYIFSDGEMPTTATLNFVGQPTVSISGTISGSTGLTPGSVGGDLLSDTLPDDVTLDWNTATPRQLEVKPAGIGTNEINTDIWQWPLSQANNWSRVRLVYNPVYLGTNAAGEFVNTDTNFIGTNSLGLTHVGPTNTIPFTQTNGASTNVFIGAPLMVVQGTNTVNGQTQAGPTLTLPSFVTAEITASNGVSYLFTTNHALGFVPSSVRWVLVCKNTELGYSVGDEVDVGSVTYSADNSKKMGYGASATEIFIVVSGAGNALQLPTKAGSTAPVTLAAANNQITNWKLKGYCRR